MKYIFPLIILLMLATTSWAKNIDLSTVPKRDTVQLTIYNAEDLTLVRETRTITFKKGSNPLQFSWANTLIDPTSVQLEFKNKAAQLTLLDTTFPHDKPQMLYWNVASEFDGEATVQISYFTSGISWAADYVGIASPDETTMKLEGFVTVRNNSGEDYEDAQVRLVVGTINLVEQIAELARRGMGQPVPEQTAAPELRQRAMREMLTKAESEGYRWAAAEERQEAKQIVKQGLSEYFIFTIEGTETIPHQWAKRMRSFAVDKAPVKIEYRYWPRQYGNQLVRMFLLTNDKEAELGESPLPDGVYRLFRRNEGGGLSYLTQQSLKYIPIGDKIELNLGPDKEVVFALRELRTFRDELWMKLRGAAVFRKVEGGVEIDVRSTVAGWDEHTVYSQRIRNYTKDAITLDIRRAFGGHVEFKSKLDPTLHDYQTVQYRVSLDPGEKREALYEVVTKHGRNAKQNNVTLVDAEPAPVPWLE